MKTSSGALRRCQRPRHSNLVALAVLVSIVGRGCAFTGPVVFPMAQNSNLVNRRVTRSSDAVSSSVRSQQGLARGGPVVSGAPAGPKMASGGTGEEGGEEEMSFVDKFKTGWTTVIEQGDPSDLAPCPSGVSEMSKPVQAFVFAAVFAALGAGTIAVLGGLSSLEALLPAGWYSIWAYTWAPLLGAVFALAGVSHFTLLKEFCNIYPGKGAWGFWYLPGTSSFHVKWTGVAEFAGGVGLLLGGLGVGAEVGLEQAAAAGLFALTLAVTPANVYMFSHGAQLPEGLEVPVVGHAIRGFLQCVLLAFFFTIAQGSG